MSDQVGRKGTHGAYHKFVNTTPKPRATKNSKDELGPPLSWFGPGVPVADAADVADGIIVDAIEDAIEEIIDGEAEVESPMFAKSSARSRRLITIGLCRQRLDSGQPGKREWSPFPNHSTGSSCPLCSTTAVGLARTRQKTGSLFTRT